MTPQQTDKVSDTPLLDKMIEEHDANPEAFAQAHGMIAASEVLIPAFPGKEILAECRWNPCTYILFGLPGETHEQYHVRKGVF